jgi:hypothetical protein
MTLPIKTVNLIFILVIKTLVWKVFIVAPLNLECDGVIMVHLYSCFIELRLTNHPLVGDVPDKMKMRVSIAMEEVYKNFVLCDPAACDEWIRKVIIDHGVIIQSDQLIDLDLSFLDLLFGPLRFAEYSQPEKPIIKVDAGKHLSVEILLDLLHPDVLILVASDFFLESKLLSLDRVHLDPALPLLGFGHRDCPRGIVGNYHRLDRVHRHHAILLYQIRKNVTVLVQLRISHD